MLNVKYQQYGWDFGNEDSKPTLTPNLRAVDSSVHVVESPSFHDLDSHGELSGAQRAATVVGLYIGRLGLHLCCSQSGIACPSLSQTPTFSSF